MPLEDTAIYISRLVTRGFKRFPELDLELDPHFSVIVGDNETGKSSVLEAIALVLKGQYDGRLIQYAIDPYLFNANMVASYRSGSHAHTP